MNCTPEFGEIKRTNSGGAVQAQARLCATHKRKPQRMRAGVSNQKKHVYKDTHVHTNGARTRGAPAQSINLCSAHVNKVLCTLDKFNFAVGECKKRVVFAATYILTWGDVGAALTNNNLTSFDVLTTIHFGAETLSVGIATVARGSQTFLMSHNLTYQSKSSFNQT